MSEDPQIEPKIPEPTAAGDDPPSRRDSDAAGLLAPAFLQRLNRARIVADKLYPGSRMGERISRSKGSGMEFSEHKPYSPGDDFRHVDWNVYARTDNLQLKTFETEMNLYVYVLIDTSASMAFGGGTTKLEYAQQLAGALGYVTLVQGDNLAVHAMDSTLRSVLSTATGACRPSELFRFCAELTSDGQTDLARSLQAFSIHTSNPGMVFLISDFFSDSPVTDALANLVYNGFSVFGFHLIDPWDEDPLLGGEIDLEDSESGEVLSLTVRRGTIGQIGKSFADHCHEVRRAFGTYQASYFPVRTDHPIDTFMLEDLRHAGVIL